MGVVLDPIPAEGRMVIFTLIVLYLRKPTIFYIMVLRELGRK
jgi:hypothetical protein